MKKGGDHIHPIDHYAVLGLPSGVEGSRLSLEDITKAYKCKRVVLHPNKKPGDTNATAEFQQLQSSEEILHDEKLRNKFDQEQVKKSKSTTGTNNNKRMRMVFDLVERERANVVRAKYLKKEEATRNKLREEIAEIRLQNMCARMDAYENFYEKVDHFIKYRQSIDKDYTFEPNGVMRYFFKQTSNGWIPVDFSSW